MGILSETSFTSESRKPRKEHLNWFHFSNDVRYTRLTIIQRSQDEISSLNKEASMLRSGVAAVDSDFSLFRHNMCSRQILRLHKLVSRLVIIFPHHFFSPIVFFIKLNPLCSTTRVCYNTIRSVLTLVLLQTFSRTTWFTRGFFFPSSVNWVDKNILLTPCKPLGAEGFNLRSARWYLQPMFISELLKLHYSCKRVSVQMEFPVSNKPSPW